MEHRKQVIDDRVWRNLRRVNIFGGSDCADD